MGTEPPEKGVAASGCREPMIGEVKAKNLGRQTAECAGRQGRSRTASRRTRTANRWGAHRDARGSRADNKKRAALSTVQVITLRGPCVLSRVAHAQKARCTCECRHVRLRMYKAGIRSVWPVYSLH